MSLQYNWNGASYDYNDVWGYSDYFGNEYAIIGSKTKIHFLNITDPTDPELIIEFQPGGNTSWRDIKTYDHYAYAVSEGLAKEGLIIYDLCEIDKGKIDLVYQKNEVFGTAHNIFIDPRNKLLFVVGADAQYNGIIIYDLSENPAEPTLITKKSLPGGYIHDLFVKEELMFCSHGYNGLYIYDITNPANPQPRSLIGTGGYNHSSWGLKDNLLIFAQEIPAGLPLGVIDYTNYLSNDIEVINTFKMPLLGPDKMNNTPHNPYIVGDFAVVSYYEDGVVIFDLSNPLVPDTIAYYDTFENDSYSGTKGCWGVYPFLPSGNILASDITNGLFILKPTFDLPSSCNNNKQDWNELDVDCGGVCKSCAPCVKEICGNGLDDDRNGLVDCLDQACDCVGNQTRINIKIMLEGFFDPSTGQMVSNLTTEELLPKFQPFKTAPYHYEGIEKIVEMPSNVIDWVLLEARDPNELDKVLSKKAGLLQKDGTIIQADGTTGIQFEDINAAAVHLVVRHKGHLGVMSSAVIELTETQVDYNFSEAGSKAMGNDQLKLLGNKYCQFAGDFDQNGIINSLDFNIWKKNSALINRYLFWDVDGNGIINVSDFNYWKINRSKIGEPMIQLN